MDSTSLTHEVRRHTRFSFTRAGGPGGQNVNKVQTRVRARLPLDALSFLSEQEKNRLRAGLANRINQAGEIVVVVDQERSQGRNREIAVRRLAALVAGALREPRIRRRTTPPRRARELRLAAKRRRAERKKLRGRVREWE